MDYNIMEYGAVADGTTNNSGALLPRKECSHPLSVLSS